MDLGPVDFRLLPLVPLADPWVVLAEAPAERTVGSPALLGADEGGTLVLAGVLVPGGAWEGTDVEITTVGGPRCTGRIDRVAEAAWLEWSRPAGLEGCADLTCPDALAEAAWEAPTTHVIVGHLSGGLRCTGRDGWARASAAGPLAPVWARPLADDALVNLAIATFRRLPAWSSIQARWLREAQPLDTTEWDSAGGSVPEVATFEVPGAPPLVTVAASLGTGCGPGFSAELSAVFERRTLGAVSELVPVAGDLPSTPGFAPLLLDLTGGLLRFGAAGRTGGVRDVLAVDGRPRGVAGCD